MTEPSWTSHVASGAAWRRFGLMVLFAPVLACVGMLVAFTALFQFFGVLASGEVNPQLSGFGRELSRLAAAIIDFLTYNSERRPFPFGAWPADRAGEAAAAAGGDSGAGARPAKTRTRAPRRRRTRGTGAAAPGTPPAGDDDAADPGAGRGESGD